jgi:hypothetical protein
MQVGNLVATLYSLRHNTQDSLKSVGLIIKDSESHPGLVKPEYVIVQWVGGPTDGVLKNKLKVISKCK